ncbi:MAG: hypothetical protein LBB80_10890 [Treponema sp.]|nr:hypothetical protein [Treponema sp.]
MQITIDNLPDFADDIQKNIFQSRILNAVNDMLSEKYKGMSRANLSNGEKMETKPVDSSKNADEEKKYCTVGIKRTEIHTRPSYP